VNKDLAEYDYNALDKVLLRVLARGRARAKRGGGMLTVYFGTPNMFVTLWFGFDYGTNPPLHTLKEQLWSLVRVHELDEITSNGGKDRSAIKEHPRGLKHKRLDFMH
jgi:hypothetical protein